MARRRKSDGGGGLVLIGLLLAIVATLVITASFLGGIAAICTWLIYEFRAAAARRTPLGDLVVFTSQELAELRSAQTVVARCEADLVNIQVRGGHLNRRNDGYFDGRSTLGRQLNEEHDIASRQLETANQEAISVAGAPAARLHQYSSAVANASALRLSVLLGVAMFVYTTTYGFEGIDSFGIGLGKHSFIDFLPTHHEYYGHVVVAVAFTFLVWGLARPLFSSRLEARAVALGYARP